MSANSKLGEQLISLHRNNFTGILTIKSQEKKQTWEIFFYLGKYLWSEGGLQANRSWQRNLHYYCPEVNCDRVFLRHYPEMRSYNYSLLNTLLQKQLIKRPQAKALIRNLSQEIFFDLLQEEYRNLLYYNVEATNAHTLLKAGFNLSLAFMNLEQILFQAQISWSGWGAKGLASCSPHHAPFLKHKQELERQLPDVIFNNMSRLLNGKNTLRDLAIRMDKSVLDVTCGIVPYFFKGYLRLLEIPDLPNNVALPQKSKNNRLNTI